MSEVNFINKSTVRLVDSMGDDQRILNAARVSTGRNAYMGNKVIGYSLENPLPADDVRDKKLIDYLWKNQHGTPFEKVVFEFYVQTPIFIARQWMRHRIGSFNEFSGRYSVMRPIFFMPDELRLQNKEGNKQGSNGVIATSEARKKDLAFAMEEAWITYKEMIDDGIAQEQARIILPVSIMTEFYWTVNLRALFNFLQLRLDGHAQPEIVQPAIEIATMVKEIVPWAWESFERHTLKKE